MEYKEVTDIIAGAHGLLDKLEVRVRKSWLYRLFWHSVNVQWHTPPIWLAPEWEVEEPFRRGKTVILRYSWGKSLVFGFWGKTGYDEADALLNATIHGRKRTDGEHLGWDEAAYRAGEFAGVSGPILEQRPQLRIRATVDAGPDD
jgi:hypothetical protein